MMLINKDSILTWYSQEKYLVLAKKKK